MIVNSVGYNEKTTLILIRIHELGLLSKVIAFLKVKMPLLLSRYIIKYIRTSKGNMHQV